MERILKKETYSDLVFYIRDLHSTELEYMYIDYDSTKHVFGTKANFFISKLIGNIFLT
jgi:hypothetical protein